MKQTKQEPNGTSFHSHTITASVSQLRSILGEPKYSDNDGTDKVNFEWLMETETGSVFTVYDWKEYRPLNETEIINWHIGGKDASTTLSAKYELNAAMEA